MSVLAAFFLIMGIVAFTVYKVKDPKKNGENYEDVPSKPNDIGASKEKKS